MHSQTGMWKWHILRESCKVWNDFNVIWNDFQLLNTVHQHRLFKIGADPNYPPEWAAAVSISCEMTVNESTGLSETSQIYLWFEITPWKWIYVSVRDFRIILNFFCREIRNEVICSPGILGYRLQTCLLSLNGLVWHQLHSCQQGVSLHHLHFLSDVFSPFKISAGGMVIYCSAL